MVAGAKLQRVVDMVAGAKLQRVVDIVAGAKLQRVDRLCRISTAAVRAFLCIAMHPSDADVRTVRTTRFGCTSCCRESRDETGLQCMLHAARPTTRHERSRRRAMRPLRSARLYMIACNHVSYADPILMRYAMMTAAYMQLSPMCYESYCMRVQDL